MRNIIGEEEGSSFQDQRHKQESEKYGIVDQGKDLDIISLTIKGNRRIPNKEKRWGFWLT